MTRILSVDLGDWVTSLTVAGVFHPSYQATVVRGKEYPVRHLGVLYTPAEARNAAAILVRAADLAEGVES